LSSRGGRGGMERIELGRGWRFVSTKETRVPRGNSWGEKKNNLV